LIAETFHRRDGRLWCEGVDLADLAERWGTPLYVYSATAVRRRVRRFRTAFAGLPVRFCYAVKANPHLALLRLLAREGVGADTVSAGEIRRAVRAGIAPADIVFAGVAKTDEEIRLALELGILQFNVESREELARIDAIAGALGRTAPVALRVNPDVAAATHDKIATGRRTDKFGLPPEEAVDAVRLAARLPHVTPVGIHLHIGSQITDLAPFRTAYARVFALVDRLAGEGIRLRRLDLGGGFGVRYRDEEPVAPEAVAALVAELLAGRELELVFEPGRAFVAEAGVLLTRVVYRKESAGRHLLVVDAGMNDLLRPALYDAWHGILPVTAADAPEETVDVVGPVCESGDVLGRRRRLPQLARGDLLAIATVGAYGAAMASTYNSRPRPAEVLVAGDRAVRITPRREPEEDMARECIPAWLDGAGATSPGGGDGDGGPP